MSQQKLPKKSQRDGFHTFRVSLPKANTTKRAATSQAHAASILNTDQAFSKDLQSRTNAKQAPKPSDGPRCRVPACPIRHCRLKSHQFYRAAPRRSFSEAVVGWNAAGPTAIQELVPLAKTNIINRERVDGLPRLPLDDANKPELRHLFHHFFASVFTNLTEIFRGVSISPKAMPEYRDRMLAVALTNKPYCMGVITQAHTDMACSRHNLEESKSSLALYTKTLSMFHGQLAAVQALPKPITDPFALELAMLVICILLFYDLTYNRTKHQEMHWKGLQYLVSLRGGIHCVTIALAYVTFADRLCAIHLSRPPAFLSPRAPIFRLPVQPESKCGISFEHYQATGSAFEKDTLEYCINSSRLARQWRPSQTAKTDNHKMVAQQLVKEPSREQLFYTRDRVDERFALLNAERYTKSARDMCLIWACRLVEFSITYSSYMPSPNIQVGRYLHSSLQAQDLVVEWSDHPDALRWVLFALAGALDKDSAIREWSTDALRNLLRLEYGGLDLIDWQDQELQLLRTFSWPESRISPFRSLCDEITADCAKKSEDLQMNTPP